MEAVNPKRGRADLFRGQLAKIVDLNADPIDLQVSLKRSTLKLPSNAKDIMSEALRNALIELEGGIV